MKEMYLRPCANSCLERRCDSQSHLDAWIGDAAAWIEEAVGKSQMAVQAEEHLQGLTRMCSKPGSLGFADEHRWL